MASEKVRELAREHPDAFERVANAKDNDVCDHLKEVLREEQRSVTSRQPVPADD